jgi:hypothetical protein
LELIEKKYLIVHFNREVNMPFVSKKQQAFLEINKPAIAKKFEEHTSKEQYKKLPQKVKPKAKKK